jgi:hypothetical protein
VMLLVACVISSTCFMFENTELTITHSHPLTVVLSNPSLSTQHLSFCLHIRYEIKRGLGLHIFLTLCTKTVRIYILPYLS